VDACEGEEGLEVVAVLGVGAFVVVVSRVM